MPDYPTVEAAVEAATAFAESQGHTVKESRVIPSGRGRQLIVIETAADEPDYQTVVSPTSDGFTTPG